MVEEFSTTVGFFSDEYLQIECTLNDYLTQGVGLKMKVADVKHMVFGECCSG